MNFKNTTTHVVIKFIKPLEDGKDGIDLVTISWTYMKGKKLFCRYPSEKEYSKIDEMSKSMCIYGEFWEGFGISIVKEARK